MGNFEGTWHHEGHREMNHEDILSRLERNKRSKKFLLISFLVLVGIIIGVLFVLFYVLNTPERNIGLGANIEKFTISSDGKLAYIKLAGGSNSKNITGVKFIFKDDAGKEYFYETKEGIKEIEVPYQKSFLDWLLDRNLYEGIYDYNIADSGAGLNNFDNVVQVEVVFIYENSEGSTSESPVLTSTTKAATTTRSPGGGSSSSGGGNSDTGCTADSLETTCLNFCGVKNNNCNSPVTCGCSAGFYCYNGEGTTNVCVNNSIYCNDSDGNNSFNRGNVTLDLINYRNDSCVGSNVTEFYCYYNGSSFSVRNESVVCTNGCSNGKCDVPQCTSDANCSDGISCTINVCNLASGCQFSSTSCGCPSGLSQDCPDDGNACTDKYCDVDLTCKVNFNNGPCTDNNACTSGDVCSLGSCSGSLISCNDEKECTSDSCNILTGCSYVNKISGTSCSGGTCDGNGNCETVESLPDCTDLDILCVDDDNIDGTAEYLTIQSAVNAVNPGQTVLVRDGVYREKVYNGYFNEAIFIENSGNPNARIIIKNYPGEKPVIDGTVLLTNWKQCTSLNCSELSSNSNLNNIYWAEIDANLISDYSNLQLFENNEFLKVAEYPNQPTDVIRDHAQYLLISSENNNENYGQKQFILDSINLNKPVDYYKDSIVSVYDDNPNVFWNKVRITSSLDNKVYIENPGNSFVFAAKDSYSLINHPNFMQDAGDYYYRQKNGKYIIYLLPRDINNLENKISVSVNTGVRIASSYIDFEGFEIRNCMISGIQSRDSNSNQKSVLIKNNVVKNIIGGEDGAGILLDNQPRNISLINNTILNIACNGRGIRSSGSNNLIISGNTLKFTESSSIYIQQGDNAQITNNYVSETGTHGNGIVANGMKDLAGNILPAKNLLVANNIIVNASIGLAMEKSENVTFYNNLVYHERKTANTAYQDQQNNTGKFYMINNLFLSNDGYSMAGTYPPSDLFIANNILEGNYYINAIGKNNLCLNAGSSHPEDINGNNGIAIDRSTIFQNSPVIIGKPQYIEKILDPSNVKTVLINDGFENVIKAGDYAIYSNDYSPRIIEKDAIRYYDGSNYVASFDVNINYTNYTNGIFYIWHDLSNLNIDYHLKQGSIAINTGADITDIIAELQLKWPDYDFYKDIDGNPRGVDGAWDIGPYEYQTGGLGSASVQVKPSSSFFSSIMNFFKGLLTGNVIQELTKESDIAGNAFITGNAVLENNGIRNIFNGTKEF